MQPLKQARQPGRRGNTRHRDRSQSPRLTCKCSACIDLIGPQGRTLSRRQKIRHEELEEEAFQRELAENPELAYQVAQSRATSGVQVYSGDEEDGDGVPGDEVGDAQPAGAVDGDNGDGDAEPPNADDHPDLVTDDECDDDTSDDDNDDEDELEGEGEGGNELEDDGWLSGVDERDRGAALAPGLDQAAAVPAVEAVLPAPDQQKRQRPAPRLTIITRTKRQLVCMLRGQTD